MIPRPFPSKSDLLDRLKRLEFPIDEVIDVGVHRCTVELLAAFPQRRQHLFEPCSLFYPDIERNYGHVPHVLHRMALSDVDETQYLAVTALKRDGVATHSEIRRTPVPVDGLEVVSCDTLPVRRFDGLGLAPKGRSLLKVDVDGADLRVLQGFGEQLRGCSLVIVEMTYRTFMPLASLLEGVGFQLFDFVDLVYYGEGLYQFDGVFLRKDLIDARVRPNIAQFVPELWRTLVKP